jgi:hypothetical protein
MGTKEYYDKLMNLLEKPYIHNLRSIGISEDQWEMVFSKLFEQTIFLHNNNDLGFSLFDSNYMEIYYEDSNGYWDKKEYDDNGNVIYLEDSNGYWDKREYDENNNLIYLEYSNGKWNKWIYNEDGTLHCYEESTGNNVGNLF